MTTYRILISQITTKGKTNKIHEVFVNSENKKEEIATAFRERYAGLSVYAEEIKEITVFVKEDKMEIRGLGDNKSKIQYVAAGGYMPEKYYAVIKKEDIKFWAEMVETLNPLQGEIKKIEDDFQKRIIEEFKLERVEGYIRNYDCVRFTFYPSWFNFKK